MWCSFDTSTYGRGTVGGNRTTSHERAMLLPCPFDSSYRSRISHTWSANQPSTWMSIQRPLSTATRALTTRRFTTGAGEGVDGGTEAQAPTKTSHHRTLRSYSCCACLAVLPTRG